MPAALAIPLITAAVSAGGGIASSLINKSGSKNSTLLPQGLDQTALLGDINAQRDLSKLFQSQGADLLGQGRSTLNKPLSYYSDILGGDRTKIMEQMAPGIAAINAQFRAPLTEAGISGRGSALAPDLEASKQSAISNQIFQAQPAAADKLTGIAQGLMGLGVNQEQAGAGVLSDAAHETLNYDAIIRGIQAQQSSQNSGMFGALGSTFGPLLKQVLAGIITPKGPATPGALAINLGPIGGTNEDPTGFLGGADSTATNPALTSVLLHLGSSKPEFASTWLDTMKPRTA